MNKNDFLQNKEYKNFIKKAVRVRKERGYTLEQIGEILSCSPSAISRFEKMKRLSVPILWFYIKLMGGGVINGNEI